MFSPTVNSAALPPLPRSSLRLSLTWLGASEAAFRLSCNVLLAFASIAGCCSVLFGWSILILPCSPFRAPLHRLTDKYASFLNSPSRRLPSRFQLGFSGDKSKSANDLSQMFSRFRIFRMHNVGLGEFKVLRC